MLIEASGLTKDFGGQRAVDGLSFTVEPGRVTGFVGPNGAGKSTTLQLMLGLLRGGGRALFDGRPYRDLPCPMREVGAVLEARAFHPGRSARGHLRMLAAAGHSRSCPGGRVPDRRVDAVLELVGLAPVADRPAGGFSLGMAQRLGLAAALLGDPRALLLDDLTAAGRPLDAEGVVFHVVQRDLPVRWLVAAAVGAQAFGHEFRYGTIRPTLLAFPRRRWLLAGKTAAAALAGTAGALLASMASLAVLLVLTRWDPSLFADPRLYRSLAYAALTVGLVAALGAGLGALTRGTGLPVALVALWAGVLEPLVVAVLGGGAGVLPFLSMLQLAAYSGEAVDLGATGPLSIVVFPLCLAVVLAGATAALERRDATPA